MVGLRQKASRPSGLAALRITTRDQHDRLVLDFWRCAMLPPSDPGVRTGRSDDLSTIGGPSDVTPIAATVADWDLGAFGQPAEPIEEGRSWRLRAGDVVSGAPELARLTLNLARIHHDRFSRAEGRLVYGGHTIGIALAELTRTLPDLITVAGWHGCDHTGPVREGDTLTSAIAAESVEPFDDRLRLITLRVITHARRDETGRDGVPVLGWRLTVLSR